MSANLELMCAYSPDDDADEDLPLFDLRGLETFGENLLRLWKRLTDLAGACAA